MIPFTSNPHENQLASVIVRFYPERRASVEYSAQTDDQRESYRRLARLLPHCYGRILYNMGKSPYADTLLETVNGITSYALERSIKGENILDDYILPVEPGDGEAIKVFKAVLYNEGDDIVEVEMDPGDEMFFAPLSLLCFLQHAIDTLPEDYVFKLFTCLRGFNIYFYEFGNYYDEESLVKAPDFGYTYLIEQQFGIELKLNENGFPTPNPGSLLTAKKQRTQRKMCPSPFYFSTKHLQFTPMMFIIK